MLEFLESLPLFMVFIIGAMFLFVVYMIVSIIFEKETRDRFLGWFFEFEDEDLWKADSYKTEFNHYDTLDNDTKYSIKVKSPIERY